jgi:hypothetical protein
MVEQAPAAHLSTSPLVLVSLAYSTRPTERAGAGRNGWEREAIHGGMQCADERGMQITVESHCLDGDGSFSANLETMKTKKLVKRHR